MPKIRNISLYEYENGNHPSYDMAIRIVDDLSLIKKSCVIPDEFVFVFSDVDETEAGAITPSIAQTIVNLLKENPDKNVLVHCVMGVSRSGAVAQFAVDFLDYQDAGFSGNAGFGREHKNADVYKLLRKVAGFSHSFED